MIEERIMSRSVRLSDGWQRNYCGDLDAKYLDGTDVKLVSSFPGGYRFYDENAGRWRKVTGRSSKMFQKDATLYYRPLPQDAGLGKLLAYMLHTISISDMLMALGASVLITVVGMLYPFMSDFLYNGIIPAQKPRLLAVVFSMFIGIALTGMLFSVVKNRMLLGMKIRMSTLVEAAFFGRCMVLPISFYKAHPAGQITERLEAVPKLCENVSNMVIGTWFSSLLSLLYFVQIHRYAPRMLMPAAAVVAVFFLLCFVSAFMQAKWIRRQMQSNTRLTALLYDLIGGVERIKLENAKGCAMQRWFARYDEMSRCTYAPPVFVRISPVLPVLLSSFAGIAMLMSARLVRLSSEQYMVFYSAFGMVLGAMISAANTANVLAEIRPQYEMLRPLLETEAEGVNAKQSAVSGDGRLNISLENVWFGYEAERPVLRGLSMQIPQGDYVAIVGETGCGKSTLLRILLGFEMPAQGRICYNGADLKELNSREIRSRMGVVLQNDRLLPGSLLENMRMANPNVTEEEIWQALDTAGIAEDVRMMPMRLETLVGERNVFSGGQTQRLHIARALLGRPSILIMDEATSALDNETQAKVAHALDELECTRIVVAHRLSTIRKCRRIIVLEEGRIAEDGTYDDLMEKKGKLYQLVSRQMQ